MEDDAQGGEEVYDKNKNKMEGKYKKVEPDTPDLVFNKRGVKMMGIFKRMKPKSALKGVKLYDKNGKELEGTYENIEDKTKGEELYDKNKNK